MKTKPERSSKLFEDLQGNLLTVKEDWNLIHMMEMFKKNLEGS